MTNDGIHRRVEEMKPKKDKIKEITLEEMIGEAGALLGQSATLFDGRTIGEANNYKPKTSFGIWLKDLVETATMDAKTKR